MEKITRQEARRLGLCRYFTGVPCKYGHLADRFAVNGHCVVCQRERSNRRYKVHGEKARASRLERYYADRDGHNERAAKWCSENKVAVALIQKRWRERNRDKRRAWEHLRLARKARAEGVYDADDILRILENQRYCCNNPPCGINIRNDYTVDHVVPLSRGGSNWPDNLQLLCQPCNSSKGNKTPAEWLAAMKRTTPTHLRAGHRSRPTPLLVDAQPQG